MFGNSAAQLAVEIVGDVAGLTRAYEDAKKQTEGLEGELQSIGKSLTGIGADLSLKVTAPLALMGGMAFKTAADFDDSMRKVAAITGATGDQFDALRKMALELGSTTAFTASQAAAAMQYLGMAGLSTNEILEATPQMLSLASAGAMDLGVAADIATNVLSGFNLTVSDLAHVSDVLAQAASSSNTSVEQLGYAMAYVGPVASSSGRSIEETTAAIQVMSNAGIQGTMAGTALRGSLSNLLSPSEQATDILAAYGLTAEDVNPEIHSLADIVDTLGGVNLSTADAMTIFGDRAGPAMLSLLRAGGDSIRDYTQALENSDGAARRMAETMEGGVGGSVRQLRSAVEGLSISFGDLIAEAIIPAIGATKGLVGWLNSLDDGTKRTIVTAALFAAALGPATWAVGALAGSVGAMIALYRTYQASTIAATIATKGFSAAIMANPIGLAIIGVTTLGAVLLPLIASTRDAKDATEEYGETLKEVRDLSEKTTETIEDEIDALRGLERELRNQISVIRSQYTPVTERQIAATRRATQETNWQKLATGELVAEFRDATDAAHRQTGAIDGLTQSQKDAIIAAKQLELTEIAKARAIRETELAARRLADGAKTAYDQASKAVSGHQRAVSDLQKDYENLKETIDRALGIDEEIETAERDVERADIRNARARQTLADLEMEIKEKELEIRTATFDGVSDRARAERDLADLKLRQREAVLDAADAEDRYQDALIESQKVKEEKTKIEKELDGESVSSAQTRLDEIGQLLNEEQKKLDVALQAREEAQIAHENLMNQIENEALEVKSQNWKEYVEYVNNNPAIARTYHIEYDADGKPKGGLPQIPTVSIQVPSYTSPTFDQTGATTNGSAAAAGATPGPGINIPTAAAVGGVSVTLHQNIYTQTQSAGEVQAATERGLRDAALQGVL